MNKISQLTRKDIIKYGIGDIKINYFGRLGEIEFLKRLYNLEIIKSNDLKFNTALEDIYQHSINNEDWPENWVFEDSRFNLSYGNDSILFNFICEVFNPIVRIGKNEGQEILNSIKKLLLIDGYEIYEYSYISERVVYRWKLIESITLTNNLSLEKENNFELKLVGQGSYANVYKFKDKNYKEVFALKRAKKDLDQKELLRFEREFETLKKLNLPYIIKVFNYLKDKNEYIMEYVYNTLQKYIKENSTKLTFIDRKKLFINYYYE